MSEFKQIEELDRELSIVPQAMYISDGYPVFCPGFQQFNATHKKISQQNT